MKTHTQTFPAAAAALVAAAILLIALGLIGPGFGQSNAASPPRAVATATPTSLPTDPFGVYFTYAGQQPQGGSQMAAAGAKWAQIHIQWDAIESQPGQYNWTALDARLANAANLGFKILITVNGNPAWAAETRCGPLYPEHLATFANFLHAAVARYSVAPYNILLWSLYNEADNGDPVNFPWLGGCWGATHPNHANGAGGAAYAAMLKVVYPAMKSANPQAQVLLTGLAYDWFTPKGLFDPNFVDDIMAAGGGPYFDAVNFHYFHGWLKSWTTTDRYNSGVPRKAQRLRQKIAAYGFDKPLVLTELGHPTDAVDPAEDAKLSEALTARLVWELHAQAMSAGIYPIIWLQAVDESWLAYSHGLLRQDLTPKLSYTAYQVMTAELTGVRFSTVRRDYADDIIGYDFVIGNQTKTVIWVTTETQKEQVFVLPAVGGSLRVVEKLGAQQTIVDGSPGDLDGLANGSVRIIIDAEPRLVVMPFLAPTLTPTPTTTTTPRTTPTRTPTPTPTQATNLITRSFQNGSAPNASYTGGIDTYVSEQNGSSSYGAVSPLIVSGSDPTGTNKDKRALLKWDLSSITGAVQSASLTLNITDHSGGQAYDLLEALTSWAENSATWNTKPAAGTTVLGVTAPTANGLVTVNLNANGLAVLQNWLNFPAKNYGLYLSKTTATDTLRLDSRERSTANLRPKLTITFKPPSINKAPWVQGLTASGATVLWETDVFAKSTFKYRKAATTSWTNKTATAKLVNGKWQAKAALTGLAANTTYEYQVRPSSNSPWTSVLSFKTTASAPQAEAPSEAVELSSVIAPPVGFALTLPAHLKTAPDGLVRIPVSIVAGSGDLAGLVFSITYDAAWLSFDPADADDDGLPDAIDIRLPGDYTVEAGEAPTQGRDDSGRLMIRLSDLSSQSLLEFDGPALEVSFMAANPGVARQVSMGFAPESAAFDSRGASYPIAVVGGTVDIAPPASLFIPRLVN